MVDLKPIEVKKTGAVQRPPKGIGTETGIGKQIGYGRSPFPAIKTQSVPLPHSTNIGDITIKSTTPLTKNAKGGSIIPAGSSIVYKGKVVTIGNTIAVTKFADKPSGMGGCPGLWLRIGDIYACLS